MDGRFLYFWQVQIAPHCFYFMNIANLGKSVKLKNSYPLIVDFQKPCFLLILSSFTRTFMQITFFEIPSSRLGFLRGLLVG